MNKKTTIFPGIIVILILITAILLIFLIISINSTHTIINDLNLTNITNAISNNDEIDALISLGYSLQQARNALQKVSPEIKDSRERIKMALKEVI